MSFVLNSATVTFRRALDIVFFNNSWRSCLMYLDNVIVLFVFSNSVEDHLEPLKGTLYIILSAQFTLEITKCKFLCSAVTYLMYAVFPGKLETEVCTDKSLKEVSFPHNKREMCSLLGLCSVYQ